MHAGLKLQLAENPIPLDGEDQFFVAPELGFGGAHRFHPPAHPLGVALIHAG